MPSSHVRPLQRKQHGVFTIGQAYHAKGAGKGEGKGKGGKSAAQTLDPGRAVHHLCKEFVSMLVLLCFLTLSGAIRF